MRGRSKGIASSMRHSRSTRAVSPQDPLAEDLYQGAIRCHLAGGHTANALRAFRRCREQLSIVLGIKPSPATLALIEAVQRDSVQGG